MSMIDGNGGGLSAADVAAVMNGGNGNPGWGENGIWWVLILFLFAMGGNGWGNGFGGGGAVPYIGQQADIQRGFDQQATTSAIGNLSTQVGQGFADAAVARCQGNAAITAAVTGAQTGITQAITASQMANMQGQNSLAMALQQCLKKVLNRAKENFHANFAVGTCMA